MRDAPDGFQIVSVWSRLGLTKVDRNPMQQYACPQCGMSRIVMPFTRNDTPCKCGCTKTTAEVGYGHGDVK